MVGRPWEDLIAAQECEIGPIGAKVSIARHPNTRGGIPPGGIGVHHPRSGAGLVNRPIPLFPWSLRFRPRRRIMWTARRPRVNAYSHARPRWMWGTVLGLGRGQRGGVGNRRHGQFGIISPARAPQSTFGQKGRQKVSTCPAPARFRFGDRRLGDVRHAADI